MRPIFQYINHPYKRPNFYLCHTKLKIELESCRRRFRTYSGAFWIGAQKKLIFFRGPVWPPLVTKHISFLYQRYHRLDHCCAYLVQSEILFQAFGFTCISLRKLWIATTKIASSDGINSQLSP